jgi:hypothetical protein
MRDEDGLVMVRSLAQDVRTTWHNRRARVRARFGGEKQQ